MPAAVTAPTASGAEAECPENRVKALAVLSRPCVGVRSPKTPDRRWGNRPRYDGRAVGTVLARYYDPTVGQFLTVDPKVAATLSPYGYVAGDPLNQTDPSGGISMTDLSAGQDEQLLNSCVGQGSMYAGPCLSAVFCSDEVSCATTAGVFATLAATLADAVPGTSNRSSKNQLRCQASELAKFSNIADMSAVYYSGGSFLNHLSAAGNDAITGVAAGGIGGTILGCAFTLEFLCTGALGGAGVGATSGLVTGLFYGLATGRSSGAIPELVDLIDSLLQEAAPG
jgi:RHS repeat-associated protein